MSRRSWNSRPTATLHRLLTVVAALLVAPAAANAGLSFDLAGDWSDAGNPNGAWRYNSSPGTPLTNHFADYDPSRILFTSAQPAYALVRYQLNGHIPFFLKAVSTAVDSRFDLPLGRVYLHNNDPASSLPGMGDLAAGISWTAPEAGDVVITGGMWEVQRYLGRIQDWTLKVNGVAVSAGTLRFDNATSANPLGLASGSGGAAALSRTVAAGDVISLEFVRAAGQPFGTTMGLDWHIELNQVTAVPEPSALALAGLGLAGMALFGRRARVGGK